MEVMHMFGFNFGTGAAIPQYKDLTFLVDVPGTSLGRFRIFGLWGDSFIGLGREKTDTLENNYNTRGTATDFGSGLGVVGMSNTYYFNENTRIKTTLSWQKTRSMTKLDSLAGAERIEIPFLRESQAESKISLSSQFRRKVNARINYSFGIVLDHYNIDFTDSLNHPDYGKFITMTDIRGSMFLFRTYGQYQHKINDRITAYSGFHLQYFGLNEELAAEPRLGMKWKLTEKQSLNLGFGMHSQVQPKSIYFYETYNEDNDSYHRTNEDLKFTRSNHYVLGYDYLLKPDLRVKVETYFQNLYKVPVKETFTEFSMINAGDFFSTPLTDSLVNTGTGVNYGMEFTFEKFLS